MDSTFARGTDQSMPDVKEALAEAAIKHGGEVLAKQDANTQFLAEMGLKPVAPEQQKANDAYL